MIKAVIFDFFGVIGYQRFDLEHEDLDKDKFRQVNILIEKLDLGLITQDEYYIQYRKITGRSITSQLKNEAIDRSSIIISEKIINLIKVLKYNGYKLGLLSNVSQKLYKETILSTGIPDLFDVCVFSFEIHLTKPDPNIFSYIAAQLNEPEDNCLMIDDLQKNCIGAQAAKMSAIKFKSYDELVIQLRNENIKLDI